MMIWEYKYIDMSFSDKVEVLLNEAGKEGWELVSVIAGGAGKLRGTFPPGRLRREVYLKRPKRETTE